MPVPSGREVLSGYRMMWLLVMFDLPVLTKQERKAATDFRHALLDFGFEMSQFSVYLRFCSSQSHMETLCGQVERALPCSGKVHLVPLTDKQYERTITFDGRTTKAPRKPPDQLELF